MAVRFKFGRNWQNYARTLTEEKILAACNSLDEMLGDSVRGKTFLDIGSGSGLFSLAAWRLGASKVYSFDYDPDSVACTLSVKELFAPKADWTISAGDALSLEWMQSLGEYDVVYSWGVLHHTGDMWVALENAASVVRPGGMLFVSIYNDQGLQSRWWREIKKRYNQVPGFMKLLMSCVWHLVVLGNRTLCGIKDRKPFSQWYLGSERGMGLWYDTVDWIGGYPFETASYQQLMSFYLSRGFVLARSKKKSGLGCNELVFIKPSS